MCCSGLLKIIMFIVNGAIFLVGAAILGVGIWVLVDSSSLLGFLDHIEDAPPELAQLANVGYLLMGLGVVLTLMGFLGCCGAAQESRCMLLTFFIIILIIFIAEVAGAIVLLVFQPLVDKLLTQVGGKVVKSIEKDYGNSDGLTTFWNTTMEELKCCGYYNYTDFEKSPFVNQISRYPIWCCKDDVDCTAAAAARADIDGCFPKLVDLIEDNAAAVGAVALGVCAVEVAAMVVAMILYKKAGKKAGNK
ncbi:tetraspanin-1-like [Clupea harengus]|uniref:Tetraspanin n=1 Tax=Clupea harengus TaxID=7950 RepID=A0A6P8EQB5_CLUHA|nr:tetraspanin-1-like [Clupea harengus]